MDTSGSRTGGRKDAVPEMTGVEVDGSAARAVSAGETGAEAETACPEEEGTTRQARGRTGISTAKPVDEGRR